MSEHLRSLVNRVKKTVNRVFNSTVRKVNLPVEIGLEIERRVTGAVINNAKPITVSGCTQNLSKTGLSFVVPFIRVGEHYLVGHGEQKRLKLRLELPNGTVRMNVVSDSFEMIMLHNSVQQYLIGVKIVQINPGDLERYEHFLKHGDNVVQPTSESQIDLVAETKKSTVSSFLSLF